jgi:hypothetical protein
MRRMLASVLLLVLAACSSSSSDCGQTMCGSSCVDVSTDPLNCGACGHVCGLGTCTASHCTCTSSPTVTMCPNDPATGWTCVDLTTDPLSCGACGHSCGLGTCAASQCTCSASPPTVMLCPNNPVNGTCIDTASDTSNCGNCGHVCAVYWTSPNVICTNGSCACPLGTYTCAGSGIGTWVCTTLQDNNNCGRCGNACTGGKVCSGGQCQ